jgi:thioredoxin 1
MSGEGGRTSKGRTLAIGALLVGLFLLADAGIVHYRAIALAPNLPPLLDDDAFERLVRDSGQPVLAEFWASWCRYCRKMDPHMIDLARQYADRVRVVRVDYDAGARARARYAVTGTPTLLMLERGETTARLEGAVARRELFDFVARTLDENPPATQRSRCAPGPAVLGNLPICSEMPY